MPSQPYCLMNSSIPPESAIFWTNAGMGADRNVVPLAADGAGLEIQRDLVTLFYSGNGLGADQEEAGRH